MSPFVNIAVHPSYGKHLTVISWIVQRQFEVGDFYIYKSFSGNRDWTLLNEEPINGLSFSDEHAREPAFYRILMEHQGESYDSPIVGIYDKLTRAEYRACRNIMNVEYKNMTRGRQGLRMLLYTPLRSGTLAPDVDPQTGQRFGAGLPIPPELDSYGERFVGGFSKPVITYIKINEMSKKGLVDDAEQKMSGILIREVAARALAFPYVGRGDLLIHPPTDSRYVVGDTQMVYYFRGIIPVAFDLAMSSLYKTDARYRVPVPELPPEER